MPVGLPDYNNPRYGVTNNNVDITNLFALSYGFAPIDFNGRIRYFDMFQAGRRGWTASKTATGVLGTVNINDPYVFHGGGSMYFVIPAVNDTSIITKAFYNYDNNVFGIEAGFRMSSDMSSFKVYGSYNVYGGLLYNYGFRLNGDTFAFEINHLSNWTVIDDFTLQSGTQSVWGAIKVVADFSTGRYKRAIVNGKNYDLSSYQMDNDGVIGNYPFSINLGGERISANDGVRAVCSYVILTEDEP